MKKIIFSLLVLFLLSCSNTKAQTRLSPKWKGWNGRADYTVVPFQFNEDTLYSITVYYSRNGDDMNKKRVINVLIYTVGDYGNIAKNILDIYRTPNPSELRVIARKLTKNEQVKIAELGVPIKDLKKEKYLMLVGYKYKSEPQFTNKNSPTNSNSSGIGDEKPLGK